jgi:predicted permease
MSKLERIFANLGILVFYVFVCCTIFALMFYIGGRLFEEKHKTKRNLLNVAGGFIAGMGSGIITYSIFGKYLRREVYTGEFSWPAALAKISGVTLFLLGAMVITLFDKRKEGETKMDLLFGGLCVVAMYLGGAAAAVGWFLLVT